MRILVLTKKFPYPLHEGEPIATTNLCRSLRHEGARLTLLAMNTTKHYFDLRALPKEYDHFEEIIAVDVDNRITPAGAVWSLTQREAYILSRFRNGGYAEALRRCLREQRFDIVQLETPFLAIYLPLIRECTEAPVVMRAHNVEHEIWERVAAQSPMLKRWYLRWQNGQLRQFEVGHLNDYDLLLAITERDLERFRQLGFQGQGLVAPVGLDPGDYRPAPVAEAPMSLGFIGALDWMPNQDGLRWFLREVWPVLRSEYPELLLEVAGKNTPDWLARQPAPGVRFLGEVPDAKAFMNRHALLVAPLFSGSGIKIKVLEGMALQRAVLTTSVGIEGIPARHGESVFVADGAAAFLRNAKACLADPVRVKRTGIQARHLIETSFDLFAIGRKVMDAYAGLLTKRPTASTSAEDAC